MTPHRWRQICDVFQKALEAKPADRQEFIEQACAGDSDLYAQVARLLASHDEVGQSSRFDLTESLSRPADPPPDPNLGRHIGSLQIKRKLGEGGMGMVYLAAQPSLRRDVALKLIRPDRVSDDLLRRFRIEAQILGRLQHAGIAQIYDSGVTVTDAGRDQPYFVMEYVRGHTLLDDALQRRLTVRQRIETLAKVCDGVHHAHQKGVIHRDLKPRNILVDEGGQPKILDFGIARVINDRSGVSVIETSAGELIGTLAYMSPEQVSGDPERLDVRSDIYALGVVGYELLSGRLPYNLQNRSIPDAIHAILNEEPPKLGTLGRSLSGDLETVIHRALAKEQEARYQSAADLAADLRRVLRGEAIMARQPTLFYQLRVLARRNKSFVATFALSLAALMAATIVSVAFAINASRANLRAQQETDRLGEVNNFFLREVFDWGIPEVGHGTDVTVRQVIDRAADRVESFSDPAIRAEIQHSIGVIYQALSMYEEAGHQLREALRIRRTLHDGDHADTATSQLSLAKNLSIANKLAEAEALCRASLQMRERMFGPQHESVVESMLTMATIRMGRDELEDAESLTRSALTLMGTSTVDTPRRMADAYLLLGDLLIRRGKGAEAEEPYRQAVSICRSRPEEAPLLLAAALSKLGVLLHEHGESQEAYSCLTEARTTRASMLPPNHPSLAQSACALGAYYHREQDYARALRHFEDALRIYRLALGDGPHAYIARTLMWRGKALYELQRYDDARQALDQALQTCLGARVPNPALTATARGELGACLIRLGQYEQAEAELLDARGYLTALSYAEPARLRTNTDRLIDLYEAWQRPDHAEFWRMNPTN